MKLMREFDMMDPIDRADWIRIELRDARLTIADIAKQMEVSKPFISDVINSRRATPRARQHIANQIKQPVDVLWPRRRGMLSMP